MNRMNLLLGSMLLGMAALSLSAETSQITISNQHAAKITHEQALKIAHQAIEKHFKLTMKQSELCSIEQGSYYLITVKTDKNSLGGGVSAKVDAYSGEAIEVFFTE